MNTTPDTRQSEQSLWSLDQWLDYLGAIHPHNIDMGLERIVQVYQRLGLDFSAQRVITVAGTNGKGTTCCLIEQAGLVAEKSVAVYSSPHILDYRERLRLNGTMLDAEQHCRAFWQVERARGDISLTYFEFSTLAALVLINHAQPDWAVLEVGLGGRLDAVNIVDPDIAVITSIDLDHQDWLGDTREKIAVEKAGILRRDIPAVIGESDPPFTLVDVVKKLTQCAYWQGTDFSASASDEHWRWRSGDKIVDQLVLPSIPLQNASTALKVLELLLPDMPLEQLNQAIDRAQLPGRFQRIQSAPEVILDVAHNPQATRLLAQRLQFAKGKKIHFVLGMLADKDIPATLQPLLQFNPHWYLATLDVQRGAKATTLVKALPGDCCLTLFDSVDSAYQAAIKDATTEDLVVVFGSFYTVAHILQEGV